MQITKEHSNEIKHRLHQQGMTLKSWCVANGFKYYTASNVLRGINKATYGEGREVAEKLGLKPDHSKTTA